jgi:hypothetical protein
MAEELPDDLINEIDAMQIDCHKRSDPHCSHASKVFSSNGKLHAAIAFIRSRNIMGILYWTNYYMIVDISDSFKIKTLVPE